MTNCARRFVACIAAFAMCAAATVSEAAYFPMRNTGADPRGGEIVLEAEDFKFESGFKVEDDDTASGSKVLVSTAADAVATAELNIEKEAQGMVMYVDHKAKDKKSNLSYVYFKNMDGMSIYTENFGTMESVRIYIGDAFGKYTLCIRGKRTGHAIDRIRIKYDTKQATAAADGEFLPGNSVTGALDITEAKEQTAGSFFMEAEDGTFGHKSSKRGEDAAASGSAYWYADSGTLTDPKATEAIGTRFKFNVTTKNNYRIWVRYLTPNANRKSTWIGVDDDNYYRIDDGNVGGWKWTSAGIRSLDTGWHSLDIKYRQAQQKIDCIIITSQMSFSPTGKGSVPGMPENPDEKGIEGHNTALAKSKIWLNGVRGRSDADFVVYDDDIAVPVTNIAMMLDAWLESGDGYRLIMRDRSYVKAYSDGSAVVNGRRTAASHGISYAPNGEYMIPISLVAAAFGLDWEYDSLTTGLYIFDNHPDTARKAEKGEVVVLENFIEDINLKIPHDNPNAKVRVWVRCSESDVNAQNKQNFDNMYLLSAGGYDYKFTSQWNGFAWSREGWVECPKPYWKDGAFYTRRGELYNKGTFDVKVSITENDSEDVFIAYDAATVKNAYFPQTTEEYKVDTNGGLYLEPTFNNIGCYIDYDTVPEAASCDIKFRRVGNAQWRRAYEPMNDEKLKQFRGSIVKVDEGTEYEVTASVLDSDGNALKTRSAKVTTWTSDVPIAKTIHLSDIYDGSGQLALLDIQGTADGWIKIDGDGAVIDADKSMLEAVYISNCRYLIFENVRVTGGGEYCMNISNGSENVRVINCDLSGWGPGDGVYDVEMGMYYINGYFPNYRSGINIKGTRNIVIERCYIHDPDARTNQWTKQNGEMVHPCGTDALRIAADSGTVVRYNDFIGSDRHRYNDMIEGANNGAIKWASVGRDSDIYGNMFIYSQDDILETDGGQMNVRVYENRGEQSLCGFSTAPSTMGPSYFFRNVLTNSGTEIDEQWGQSMKMGGLSPDGYNGIIYIFNNTFDVVSHVLKNGNYGGSSEYHSVSRNNIAITRTPGNYSLRSYFANERDSNDYDLCNGVVDLQKNNGKDELHMIVGEPTYEDMANGDFRLTADSLGVDAGENLPNFSDGYVTDGKTDIGAFERGSDRRAMPYRPVDMWADTYFAQIKHGEERSFTVHIGDVEDIGYSVVKNTDYGWLEILTPIEGTTSKNGDITVTIKANLDNCEYVEGNGMVLFRLDNGYSVPVTVYAAR